MTPSTPVAIWDLSGDTGGKQTFTVMNNGNADLVLPVALAFAPTTTGLLKGSVVLTDNHLNTIWPCYATVTISLSGAAQ